MGKEGGGQVSGEGKRGGRQEGDGRVSREGGRWEGKWGGREAGG